MNTDELAFAITRLEELEETILTDLGVPEASISHEEKVEMSEELKTLIAPLKRSRGVVKRKISILLKNILSDSEEDRTPSFVSSLLEEIALRQEEVRNYDREIEAKICSSRLTSYDLTTLNEEVSSATHYHLQNQKILSKIKHHHSASSHRSSISSHSSVDSISRAEVLALLKNHAPQHEVKIPPLRCKNFSGEGDRFQFRSFLLSFNNIYACRNDISDAAKLQYLKSHLTGYALRDVEHLPNINENYQVAIKTLRDIYLDIPFIIDSLFHKIDSAPVIENKNIDEIRPFLSEVRAHLYELKEFEIDFFDIDSAGSKFLSHVIVDKLPLEFLRELRIESKEEYPSIVTILERHQRVIKTIEKMRGKGSSSQDKKNPSPPLLKKKHSSFNSIEKISKGETKKSPHKDKSVINSTNASPSVVECKLCGNHHYMSSCTIYSSPKARRDRCIEIGRCADCSSTKHPTKRCPAKKYGLTRPCFFCRKGSHISALCPSGAKPKTKDHPAEVMEESSSVSSSSSEHLDAAETFRTDLCTNAGISITNSDEKKSKGETERSPQKDKRVIDSSATSPSVVECRLCGGDHYTSSCQAYSSSKERKKRCIEIGVCVNCLSSEHTTKQCPAENHGLTRPCYFCQSLSHFSALCPSRAKVETKDHLSENIEEKLTESCSSSESRDAAETNFNGLCINVGISAIDSSTKKSRRETERSPQKVKEVIKSENAFSSVVKCELCERNHMSSCTIYSSPKLRRDRCVELGGCANCPSTKHSTKQCPVKYEDFL